MSLKRRAPLFIVALIVAIEVLGSFLLFESYARNSAEDLVTTILRAESASIQQGNLLASISKLESAVLTSNQLRGVAVFDEDLDTSLTFPLLSLGNVAALPPIVRKLSQHRVGLFSRVLVRPMLTNKVLVFYFQPTFLVWTFFAFTISLLFISLCGGLVVHQISKIRQQERADAIETIWKQISHDIRSPIGALKIFASVVRRSGRDADLADTAIERIEQMVDELKLQSDLAGTSETFDLCRATKSVVDEKRLEFADRLICLSGDFRYLIRGSKGHYQRMISNLLNNAIEASDAITPINVILNQGEDSVSVTVKDFGKGVAPENQKTLFKRGMTHGKTSGSGLGLFHAQQTVKSLGGAIKLTSELGKGTQVTIHLKSS